MVLASVTTTFRAAVPPILTAVPVEKFDPVTVMRVPPTVGPEVGEIEEIERVGVGPTGLSPQDIISVVRSAAAATRTTARPALIRAFGVTSLMVWASELICAIRVPGLMVWAS